MPDILQIIGKNPTDNPPPSNIIVVGDAEFSDQAVVERTLTELHAKNPAAWVITGGERGIEHWAWSWAARNGVDVSRYYPKWRSRGRFAAFDVQRRLLRCMFDPKIVVGFLRNRANSSVRTLLARAEKMGIEVVVKRQSAVIH